MIVGLNKVYYLVLNFLGVNIKIVKIDKVCDICNDKICWIKEYVI